LALVIVTFFMGMLVFTIRSAVLVYYFKYNIGDESLFEVFLAVSVVGQLIGIVAAPFIAARLGKMQTNLLGFVVVGISGMGIFYTPYDQIGLLFAIMSIGSLFIGLITVVGWSLLPDTVEYAEWRTGIRADGAIYAVASFFHKMSMAVGGFIGAMILAMTDYVPKAPQQSEGALDGIAFAVGAAPAICLFVAAIAIYFYPLNEKRFQKISKDLIARKARA
jgi:Na+/melibiose symporter-like transporter